MGSHRRSRRASGRAPPPPVPAAAFEGERRLSARSALVVWIVLSGLLWMAVGSLAQISGLWADDAGLASAELTGISPVAGAGSEGVEAE
jgi:hypothetical protein